MILNKFFRKKTIHLKQKDSAEYFSKLYEEDSLYSSIEEKFPNISSDSKRKQELYHFSEEELLKEVVDRKLLSEEKLYTCLAEYLHTDYIPFREVTYTKREVDLLKEIESSSIERYRLVLLNLEDNRLHIGMSSPCYLEVRDLLRLRFNDYDINLSVVSLSTFNTLHSLYLDKLSIGHEIENIDFTDLHDTSTETDDLTNEDNPIVKLVNNIFVEAVRQRSSDIHIEPYASKTFIKNRIDGVLIENSTKIPGNYHEAIISRIKIMSKLNIAEHRMPQDGRIKKDINNKIIDFRVSILPTVFGESVVIRILDKKDDVLLLKSLGASPDERESIIKNASLPYGMVLVTGPTGSGKTTTLYAILNEIKDSEKKVITIEDPVEYQLDNAVQIPVNEKAGLTFAKGLRSILRQDPDKIMVGEIRDRETAEIAMQAALTGHLVISTLHANNTVEAIGRLTNIGVDPFQFATALNLVIGQRLMRKICSTCSGEGCRQCNNTGYYGRTGVYEIFSLNEEIKEMIIEGRSPLKIKEKAIENNMKDLKGKAAEKVRENITSISEYERVIGEWAGDRDDFS